MKKTKAGNGSRMDQCAYHSGMLLWNPAWKMGFAVSAILCCVGMNKLQVSVFVILSMGILTVKVGKLSLGEYLRFFRIPAAFLLMGTIAIAIGVSWEMSGDWAVHLKWFYIYSSADMIREAAEVLAKSLGAVSALYMLALSTPSGEWIGVLSKLHIPDLVIELMHLIYRFIFIIADSERQMHTAAQSRNGYADWKTSMRTFGKTGANLLVLSLRKAKAYNIAMESRCCDGPVCFLEEEKPVRIWQIAVIIGYLAILVGLWQI